MRVRKHVVTAALALPLMAGTAGCGELQEAKQGLDQAQQSIGAAQACSKALQASQFTPNFSDPQQAQEKARAKAEELGKLAEQTGNKTLKQNLLDVQASVERVASGDVTADNAGQWVQGQLERTQKLIRTCQQVTG